MPRHLTKLRSTAFQNQNGRCYYCNAPMWSDNAGKFATTYSISKTAAGRFQCTAEHLIARCDGGKNKAGNVVAACSFCNHRRHFKRKVAPSAIEYKRHIQKRIRKGKWLPKELRHVLAS